MGKILVVDDEKGFRDTFVVLLTDEGHEVLGAADYDEAVKLLSERDPDVIFSDIVLGERTGIDLLREVRARRLTCPVIVMTGYPHVETASEAVRLGAFDYLAKPLNYETLVKLVDGALRHRRAVDDGQRLQAVFASVREAIISVDRDLVVLDANAAAEEICGIGRAAIGRRLDVMDVACKDAVLQALRSTIETRQAVQERQLDVRRWPLGLTVSTYPLMDRGLTLLGAVLVARNDMPLARSREGVAPRPSAETIIGRSRAIREVRASIETLANVATTVLVTGESGTGKELVAEALHHAGVRRDGPLVKVNCAALPESLLESELFGHVKGAFTGAAATRIGRFQRAHEGTILLDEIGDVSPRVQVALLRILQDGELERLGDSRPIHVDVRVIASTNRNLAQRVARGEFREDLYYRLKVAEIAIPPLRARREDVPLLIEHVVAKLNRKLKREIRGVAPDVERVFLDYPWPGNVRELEHALEHAFIRCRDDVVGLDHLPREVARCARPTASAAADDDDADAVRNALVTAGWNKAKAARLLGIDRKTLYRKLARYAADGP